MTTNSERNTKAIGIGLSTADALSRHLGGEFYLKDIKNDNRESVATEAVFTIPTCYLNDCHHYNLTLKQNRFEEHRFLPNPFQSYEMLNYLKNSSKEEMSLGYR